ncbi:MAG: hypothetical protein HY707_12950 [Ignavibacteriae bacterium]|nr:hypothetical protein [Ignavibacteriota bacterium]
MKNRVLFVLIIAAVFTMSFAFAQNKDDCSPQTVSVKKAGCCAMKAKAAMASETKTSENVQATVIPVKSTETVTKTDDHCATAAKSQVITSGDAKQCTYKTAKNAAELTEAEKAHCDMIKAANVADKAACCKDKAKTIEAKSVEAKDTKVKQVKAVVDSKGGTN